MPYCIIFLVALLSIWAGNLVTSFFYRLPRNIKIHRETDPPMCSNCGAKLRLFYAAVPVLGYLAQMGIAKCCRARIPFVYTAIEISTAIAGVAAYSVHGIDKMGLSIIIAVPVLVCVIFTFYYNSIIPKDMLWAQLVVLLIYRLYGTNSDIYSVVWSSAFAIISILVTESVCNKTGPADVRTSVAISAGFMANELFALCYIALASAIWGAYVKSKINARHFHIAATALLGGAYLAMLLYKQ